MPLRDREGEEAEAVPGGRAGRGHVRPPRRPAVGTGRPTPEWAARCSAVARRTGRAASALGLNQEGDVLPCGIPARCGVEQGPAESWGLQAAALPSGARSGLAVAPRPWSASEVQAPS